MKALELSNWILRKGKATKASQGTLTKHMVAKSNKVSSTIETIPTTSKGTPTKDTCHVLIQA
jgi:hypothetical protein